MFFLHLNQFISSKCYKESICVKYSFIRIRTWPTRRSFRPTSAAAHGRSVSIRGVGRRAASCRSEVRGSRASLARISNGRQMTKDRLDALRAVSDLSFVFDRSLSETATPLCCQSIAESFAPFTRWCSGVGTRKLEPEPEAAAFRSIVGGESRDVRAGPGSNVKIRSRIGVGIVARRICVG